MTLTGQETDFSFASCDCFNTDVSCEAEAATRRDVTVVERCPPGSGLPPCAAAGENCRPEYLDQNGLAGCCQGLSCAPNAAGVPTCQPATSEELALAAECDRVARADNEDEVEVLSPGSFDFHLGGTIGGVTFEDQHLVVRGVMCGGAPAGSCPEG